MKIELPENYVAFVLSKATEKPSAESLEKLRLATVGYLQSQLKEHFPNLKRIELDLGASEYKANKPEPRFNLFLETQAAIYFDGGSKLPDKNDVFEKFISAFNREYLLQKVRKLEDPSLKSAVEVQAKRLKRATAGGAVKVPAFYMGFVLSQEPSAEPTQQEQDTLLEKAQTEATKVLRLTYKDDFDEVTLKIVKTAIGKEAGKPDESYNLYVEFEAVVFFTQNAQEPMDVFQALSCCLSTEFIMDLMTIGGSFAFITQMVIRLCIIIEIPLLEDDDGDGEGEKEPIIVKFYLEFFVALVVRMLGEMPSPKQLHEFDSLIQEFFSEVLSKAFPKGFVDMQLTCEPEFEAGLPVPRFNILHPYNATLQFYSPPPDGAKILQKIMRGNLSPLFEKIKGLSGPWDNTAEVTMGKAVERPPTDEAHGGKIEEDEIEVEEEKKEEIPLPPPPKPEPKKETPKPPAPKPTPQAQPKEEPKAPTKATEETVTIGTSDVFVAFTIPGCDDEPYHRDYAALAKTTQDFYGSHLKQKFGSCFENVELSVSKTYFGQNEPNGKYNIYIEWDMQATFKSGVDDESIPDRYQLCRSLVKPDMYKYLTEYVRALEGTPFAGAIGMFTEQVNS